MYGILAVCECMQSSSSPRIIILSCEIPYFRYPQEDYHVNAALEEKRASGKAAGASRYQCYQSHFRCVDEGWENDALMTDLELWPQSAAIFETTQACVTTHLQF